MISIVEIKSTFFFFLVEFKGTSNVCKKGRRRKERRQKNFDKKIKLEKEKRKENER